MAEERINYVELPERETPDAKQLELIDIEQPIEPGVDWLLWFELGLSFLLLGLILLFVIWLGRQLWPGLQIQLKLKQAQKRLKQTGAQGSESKAVLFESLHQAKQKQLLTEEALGKLGEQINQICFSSEDVSHETLSATFATFLSSLKENRLSIKQIVKNRWMRFQSQISQEETP